MHHASSRVVSTGLRGAPTRAWPLRICRKDTEQRVTAEERKREKNKEERVEKSERNRWRGRKREAFGVPLDAALLPPDVHLKGSEGVEGIGE